MSFTIKVENVQQLKTNMQRYLNEVSTQKQRYSILRAGAVVINRNAKKMVPKSDKDHYYHRAGQKVKILSGNLRNSMYVFKVRTGEVQIGPRVLRSLSGLKTIGDSRRNSSGYYSHMIYGSANAFRRRITEPAMNNNLQKINNAMFNALTKINERLFKKYGFL